MRTWTRAGTWTMCGFCVNEMLTPGDPVLLITGIGADKIRCGKCAGPVPPDLPALPERVEIQSTRKTPQEDWRGVGALAVDYKLKQAGDR